MGSKNLNKTGMLALAIGIAFFLSVIFSYAINFSSVPVSGIPSDWGVFGDFVGGIVNPILGLVTIWLLTVSLRQNNEMLDQARTELKATLEELKRGQDIQAATKEAMKNQIIISQNAHDLDAVIKLISYWESRHDRISAAGRDEQEHWRKIGASQAVKETRLKYDAMALEAREKYNQLALDTLKNTERFNHIMAMEEKRLLDKYPSELKAGSE